MDKFFLVGYVTFYKSRINCHSGQWLPPLDLARCVEGVALVTGGNNKTDNLIQVEVYGPNNFKRSLANLTKGIQRHSVDYVDGAVYLCGGVRNKNLCLIGEYQPSSKGILWFI